MVNKCIMCKKYWDKGCGRSFHKFPKKSHARKIWLDALCLKEEDIQVKTATVCSDHFSVEDLVINASGKTILKFNAVPAIVPLLSEDQSNFDETNKESISDRDKPAVFPQTSLLQSPQKIYYPRGTPSTVRASDDDVEDVDSQKMFPKQLKVEWLSAIGREPDTFIIQERVCSDHFRPEDFEQFGALRKLKANVIPTINLPKATAIRDPSPDRKIISVTTGETCMEPLTPSTSKTVHDLKSSCCQNFPLGKVPSSSSLGFISSSSETEKELKLERDPLEIPTSVNYIENNIPTSELDVPVAKDITVIIDSDNENNETTTSGMLHDEPSHNTLKNKVFENKSPNKRKISTHIKYKVYHLNDIVKHLKHKSLLSPDACYMLEKTYSCIPFAVMKRLLCNSRINKISEKTYDPVLRRFAMTLHFYSSKAYEYVQQTFSVPLPSQTMIRNWYSNMSCDPGFSQLAFLSIKSKAKDNSDRGHGTFCNLMLEEMSIKRDVDCINGKLWGYIDLGTNLDDDDSIEVASSVLVLMVVALNGEWKLPIGYFFVRSLTNSEKANIILETIIKLHDCGVVITSLTCDGPAIHFRLLTQLGAKFNDVNTTVKKANIVPYFYHPVNKSKVFILFDACHLVNILRINWACLGQFLDPDGNEVDFKYLTILQHIQEKEGLQLDLQKQKNENVNTTIQALSQNVSAAMEFLKDDKKDVRFKDSSATLKFIQLLDKVYNLLNSTNPFSEDAKMPLKKENEDSWLPILQDTVNYFANCRTVDNISLISTNKKSPFKGFILTILSIIGIYQTYIKPDDAKLKYLLTYKLSQDHLDEFFCKLRSSNKWNCDPTAWQFRNAYENLLLHHYIRYLNGNCGLRMLSEPCNEEITIL